MVSVPSVQASQGAHTSTRQERVLVDVRQVQKRLSLECVLAPHVSACEKETPSASGCTTAVVYLLYK